MNSGKLLVVVCLCAVFALPAFAGVSVSSPSSGTTSGSPVHFVAIASSPSCSKESPRWAFTPLPEIGIHGERRQDGYESDDEQWNLQRRRSGVGQLWMVCHCAAHLNGQRFVRFGRRFWKRQSVFQFAEERRVDGLCSSTSRLRHLFQAAPRPGRK